MGHCKICGKWKLLINSDGLCLDCMRQKRISLQQHKQASSMKNRTYHVVGLPHYKDGIKKAFPETEASLLPKKEMIAKYPVGSRISKYNTKMSYPAQLIPEPDNPYDKNAIAVYVNGEKIGHIGRGSAAKVDIPFSLITSTIAKVTETPYKEITQDNDGKYHITTAGLFEVSVTISFH